MSRAARAAALLLLCAAGGAFAALRARYGGTLKVALVGKMSEADPLYAEDLHEAALVSLVAQPLCRLDAALAPEPALAQSWSRPTPQTLELRLGQAARADGPLLGPSDVAKALARALAEPGPSRALLLPLADASAVSAGPDGAVTLRLAFPWPDLERALCHPALAIAASPRQDGAGPFRAAPGAGSYRASAAWPGGRPFLDAVQVSAHDARSAARALAQRRAHLALGAALPPGASPPLLAATVLLYSGERGGPGLRAALEAAVDRDDLSRFFVRAPSAPMRGLLPPLLDGGVPAPPRSPPPPAGPSRPLELAWDAANEDHRAVAERLQVKLSALGYRVALKPLPRRALREAWARGDHGLLLRQVLLPPVPAPALAVVASLARSEAALEKVRALGAVADGRARDERARSLALELAPSLELFPLYVQGLAVQAGPDVQQLRLDGFGLPRLDAAFLAAEGE